MRISETEILIIPGWLGSSADHWQSRWVAKLKTARRIDQKDWETPQRSDWVANIIAAAEQAQKPAILVAHSLGVHAVAHAGATLPASKIAGLFLVSPPDIEDRELIVQKLWPAIGGDFAPIAQQRLNIPTLLIASRTDPYCCYERACAFADNWGAELVDAGDAGHITDHSGHGPWPEGLMRFGAFLKSLD